MTDLEKYKKLKEVASLLERIKTIQDEHGPFDVQDMFSIHGSAAQNTRKTTTLLGPKDVTTNMIGSWVSKALNTRVGLRREYASEDLASYIGASITTIEKYKIGDTPSTQNFFRMTAFFGPEFASEIFAPLGMTVVESDSAQAAQSLSIEGLTEMLPQIRNYIDIIAGTLNLEGDANED